MLSFSCLRDEAKRRSASNRLPEGHFGRTRQPRESLQRVGRFVSEEHCLEAPFRFLSFSFQRLEMSSCYRSIQHVQGVMIIMRHEHRFSKSLAFCASQTEVLLVRVLVLSKLSARSDERYEARGSHAEVELALKGPHRKDKTNHAKADDERKVTSSQ